MATITVGATAGTLDLTVKRGDTIGPVDLDWGASHNLADRTWAAHIRSTLDEPTPVTATFTVSTASAATGLLVITLTATESKKLVTVGGKATYYWDLQATSIANPESVFTWLAGKVKVSGDVTVLA